MALGLSRIGIVVMGFYTFLLMLGQWMTAIYGGGYHQAQSGVFLLLAVHGFHVLIGCTLTTLLPMGCTYPHPDRMEPDAGALVNMAAGRPYLAG